MPLFSFLFLPFKTLFVSVDKIKHKMKHLEFFYILKFLIRDNNLIKNFFIEIYFII